MSGSSRSASLENPIDELTLDSGGWPLPPWRVYPWWPTSMGWRMGGGEWYILHFGEWLTRQNAEARQAYRRRYPPPLYWWHFYGRYWSRGNLGCLLGVALLLATLPVTVPSFWWHRLRWSHRAS